METAKTTKGARYARTLVLAAPAGLYLGITGVPVYGWSELEAAVITGGTVCVLLFGAPLAQGARRASANSRARATAKAAKAKAKADKAAEKVKKLNARSSA